MSPRPHPATLRPQHVDAARIEAQRSDRPIVQCLGELTDMAPAELTDALGELLCYPVWSMERLRAAKPDFEAMSFAECSSRAIVRVHDPAGSFLLLADPFDSEAEAWARQRLRTAGLRGVRTALAAPDDLTAFLALQEQQLRAMDGLAVADATAVDEQVAAVLSLSSIGGDASPVVKLVNSTIYDAIKLNASDIHLENDAGCLHVQYRIDGVLVPITQVQGRETAEQVISRIKVMAELDIAERRVPQDGRFKVRVNERDIDLRVSVMPNIHGEDAVLRLLDRRSLAEQASSLRLDHLGLDAASIDAIRRLAARPHGMLLVTGPTGSGKTTTLYATITEIHTGRDKIVTIEDPVEYRLPRVLQIPVNERKGLTFARGLRSILRHDPDKIMVGEIRDGETAQIAVQAALTGHLVLTTVHANSIFDVLGRFLHMGVDAYSFAAALNGIVAQRLLRVNCPQCSRPATLTPQELIEAELSGDDVRDWRPRAGSGCGHCRGTGYKGRRAVTEVLTLDDSFRELISARAPISQLRQRALAAGLRPLRAVARALVADGETTLAEVQRVAG